MLLSLYRALVLDRSRTLLSVLAVGAAIVLVVVLEGFKVGLWQQVRAYPEHLPVQLIAVQSGVRNMTIARSTLPAGALAQVKAVPGVQEVYPLLGIPVIFAEGAKKTPVYVLGHGEVGGPWRLRQGTDAAGPGELVMDYGLARKSGLAVGDRATLLDKEFRIVGLSEGTSSMFNSYLFIGLDDARTLGSPGQGIDESTLSFLLIKLQLGVDTAVVRKAVEGAAPPVDVFTPAEMAANDVATGRRLMASVIDLLVAVAYVVGILVIGLTLYAAVFERRREYGVMKAIGATNSRLYQYVLAQAVAFAAAGLGVGLLASQGVAALLSWAAPQYLVVPWDTEVVMRSGIAAVIMASLASLLPIRQVAGVDPALVFKQ
ncbi:MAG: FtsX-like permease family protein [Chloroflexi bacterium]|nr:FtsX-like permease family protein [Chloroflexota bacterium]